MLKISEHFEFYNKNHLSTFQEVERWQQYYDLSVLEDHINFKADKDKNCLTVNLQNKKEKLNLVVILSHLIT